MRRNFPGIKRLVACGLFLALSVTLLPLPARAQVRVPRDSPLIIHGRVQQPVAVEPPRYSPAQAPSPDFILRRVPSPPIEATPRYRPLWVPGTYLWSGFESVWQVGSVPARFAALVNGSVQGALLIPPETVKARELGYKILANFADIDIEDQQNGIYTTRPFINKRPDPHQS